MLIIKDFFHKIYLKISNSKFIKWIFPVFIICLVPNVLASEMIFGANGSINIYNGSTTYVKVNQTTNNLPKVIYGLANSSTTVNLGVLDLELSPASGNINVLDNSYNYLIFDVCTTGAIKINISNSSCTNSCVTTGTYTSISTNSSCTTGGYSGTRQLVQVRIQKWYLNEVAEMLETSSYISVTNGVNYSNPLTINQVFLSNEDYILVYKNQADLINKLNSVQTTITNMQNSINSNANANAAQAHSDHEDLMNQDHNYNNNSSDNVPDKNNISNVTTAESDLLDRVNLDASSIDVTLSSNTTNFIWDIVTNLRATNGKITLLFTSILSLAIIKMVLNR